MRLALALVLTLCLALPGLGLGAPTSTARLIAEASALEARWGRCPTAPPAARILEQARRSGAPVPRARRARAAVRAWTEVARVCSLPVDQPTVA